MGEYITVRRDVDEVESDSDHYFNATVRQRQRAERAELKLKQIREVLDAPWEGESAMDRLDHIEAILDPT